MDDMIERLKQALDQLRLQGRTVDLFFRDDDVDDDEDSLRTLLDLFLLHEIPVNLQIIPGRLTGPAVALLSQYWNLRSDLFELNQHGWLHFNHEAEGRKCEFGPSRRFDQQLADIAGGKKVLEDAFGRAFTRVFTPPWNRCTTDTFRALDQLGFEALSKKRGADSVSGYSFREISVTLDLYQWKNEIRMKAPGDFINELLAQLREFDLIGVMLHHKVMNKAAFDFLAWMLGELRSYRSINFHTFQSLLKAV